jgi:bacterioferritin-associated ferredoxin
MFVCLCQGVTDTKIINAIHDGCNSIKAIRQCTGAASQCCKCLPTIRDLLAEHSPLKAEDNKQFIEVACC